MQNRPDDAPEKPRRFNPFLARSRAMNSSGPSGLEATTIGFTLVGFIVAGAGAGWMLDKWLGTSYWLPILFLVGVFGGFREMMLVLKRVNEAQAAEKKRKESERRSREVLAPTENSATEQSATRKRMFEVPPPPFKQSAPKVHDRSESGNEETSAQNVLEEMLARGDLSAADLKELGFDVELPANDDEKSDDSTRAS